MQVGNFISYGVGKLVYSLPERGGEPPLGGGGVPPQSVTSSAAMSKPSGGIRSLHSLSAWDLPTPVVALACIGNVDIRLFFLCKWVTLFHTAVASLSVYRLSCTTDFTRSYASFFFFAEKKKKAKKKEFAFHLYCAAMHHTKIIQEIFTNKNPRRANRRLPPP